MGLCLVWIAELGSRAALYCFEMPFMIAIALSWKMASMLRGLASANPSPSKSAPHFTPLTAFV